MKLSPKTIFQVNKRTLLLLLLCIFFSFEKIEAQGCECTDCDGPITPMTTDTYVFNIAGATNNDLANSDQGVCGIFIDFNANHVWSLTITLTSPSGQVITLIGPYDNFAGSTLFTNWDISFLPCAETVMPDLSPIAYTPQWSNLQGWGIFENYIGSYYPYIGCLEDFNTGPVNGDWTLTVTNGFANMNTNTGALNGFSILFCDEDGTGCDNSCNAFAGDLSVVDDIEICEGDSFTGSIDPFYSFGTEPNNQFSYDYIISQNGVITGYETNPEISSFSTGVYEICGLSYLTSDVGNIPSPNGVLSVADLENLLNTTAPFCGDISDDCFMVEVLAFPDTIFIEDDFCQGSTYTYEGNNFTTGGIHYITLPSAICDTTVELTLNELTSTTEDIEVTICRGDTVFVGNSFYTTNGFYPNNLTSTIGCDSVVNLDLTVLSPESNIAPTIPIDCSNFEIDLDGTTSTSGTGITYLWSTNNGSITGDINENETSVDAAGKYYLTVTVTQNGVACSNVDSITIVSNINLPTANAGVDSILNCTVTEIVLDGNGPSTGGFSYGWTTTNGNIVQDTFTLNPLIDAAGTYVLTVLNLNNNCVAQDTVEITNNSNLPIADAGNDLQIDCDNASIELDGTGSSVGTAFIYQWTTLNGNILLGENSLTPTVDSAGTYELLVTDTFNQCTSMETVMVTFDTIPPIADAGADIDLNCFTPQTQIDATNSSQGNDFIYQWTVISGAPLVNGTMTLTPTVNGAGVYELRVLNTETGCFSVSQVTVNQDFIVPSVDVVMPVDTVTCLQPIIEINAGNSSNGTNFDAMWTVIGMGNITSGANGLFPQIDQAGTYELEIENTQNGCTVLDTVEVFANNTLPNVDAGADSVINCYSTQGEISLNGSGDSGGVFDVTWNALNGGNIVSGGSSLSPIVNAAGDYELVITNTSNSCTLTDTTSVTVDTIPPLADAGGDINLSCTFPQTQIDATNSSQGINFNYQWNVISGAPLVDGINSLTPTVDGAGMYELVVINITSGCTAVDTVMVNQDAATPSIDIEMPIDTITCLQPIIEINAGNSSVGIEFEYTWTVIGMGNIDSGGDGLFPQINQAGSYELEITNIQNGCIVLDTVEVFANNTLPSVNAGNDLIIDCNVPQLQISLNGSGDTGGIFDIAWTELNGGNIVSGENTLSPIVNMAGDYELLITNTQSGCTQSDTTTISFDTIPPIANTGDDTVRISCFFPTITLDGSGSSMGDFSYLWSTSNGTSPDDETTLQPTISVAGDYELLVTNNQNGCTAIDSIVVLENFATPIADAGVDTFLTCADSIIFLNGNNSSMEPGLIYQWIALNGGNILSGPSSLEPEIDATGTYQLNIINAISGCVSIDEVIVTLEDATPTANAGLADTISCNEPTLILDGNNSSTGGDFSYEWTTTNGSILNGGTTLSPEVDSAGTYILTVTNDITGCTSISDVVIEIDTLVPMVDAGMDTAFTCVSTLLELNGLADVGNNFIYNWTTSGEGTISDATILNPIIDDEGLYELEVTNILNGCVATDEVEVIWDTLAPIADAGMDGTLNCDSLELTLGGNSSQGNNITYEWTFTAGGSILTGINEDSVTVNSGATYTLTVTNTGNDCIATDEVIVTQNADLPIANAGLSDTITCTEPTLVLDGSNSSSGGNFSYGWTTVDGNILNGDSTLSPEVDSAGTYILTVTNDLNGCMSMSNVAIEIDTLVPMVDAGIDTAFTCVSTLLELNGTADVGNNFIYNWTTSGVGTISDATILNPIIDDEGLYELEVTNILNGCVATDEVQVVWDTLAPIADAGMDGTLNCDSLELTLGGNSSQGSNVTYEWTFTAGGSILTGINEDSVTVNSGATYALTVTNIDNNCIATDEVIVTENADLPIANAGLADTITCTEPTLVLDGSNSSSGGDFSYGWTTMDGNILNGDSTLSPEVDSAGTYILTVTNDLNGCMSMSNVVIEIDTLVPMIDAGIDTAFTCVSTLLELNGTADVGNNFIYNWTTGGVGTISDATILNPIIDDEGLYELEVTNILNGCVATDEVQVVWDTLAPIADAGLDTILDCDILNVVLGGNSSMNDNIEYSWTSTAGGSIVSNPNNAQISVNTGAIYTLTVTNTDNNCSASDDVEVLQDANLPMAIVAMPDTIACGITQVTLDGSGSSIGNEFIYEWTTTDGNIVSDTFTLFPIIASSGTYILTVKNTINKCEVTTAVNIIFRDCTPIANAGADADLNCNQTTLILDGSGSSIGADFNYEWTTLDGNIVSDTFTLFPTVSTQGTYILTVENMVLGLTAVDSVVITESLALPTIVLTANDSLDCAGNNVIVSGVGSSSGFNYFYSWSTNEGNITAIVGIASISVSAPGFYVLEITDSDNGCVAIDSIEVFQNIDVPIADAGDDLELNCYNSQWTIGGSNTSIGNNITHTWTSTDGNIVSGENAPTAIIDSVGIYILEVVNMDNGCMNMDSVLITENYIAPISDAGNQDTLNCFETTLILDGSNSSMGMEMIYQWNTLDGNILLGENTLTPQIDSAGNYELIVTNNLNGCADTSTVIIDSNFITPIADAGTDMLIDCGISNINLDGGNSSMGGNLNYIWTTNGGNIVSDSTTLSPEVNLGGLYILTIENTESGCTATDTTVVTTLNCAPNVTIFLPDTLTCAVGEITLDGSGSSDWQTIVYDWTILGTGNITGSTDSAITTVNQPGNYILTLTDTQNGNTAFGGVTVIIDNEQPVANAGLPDTLNCNISQLTLDGSASDQGAEFQYQWNAGNGNIVNGQNGLTPLISEDATYELIVTNTDNGCVNNSFVTIAIDTIAPDAIAGNTMNLTCVDTLLFLNGFGSSVGVDFTYQWNPGGGNIVNGGTTLVPQINAVGTYELTVLNNHNFCEATSTVEVGLDTIAPTISFVEPEVLNCDVTEVILDASNSSSGIDFGVSWQSPNGNIASGANGLTPSINDGGDFILTILDFQNGCVSEGTATVLQDTLLPISNAGNTVELTCVDILLSLDGSASDQGAEFQYQWNTIGGNIVDGPNTMSPSINLPGSYELVVTNDNNMCTASSSVQVTQDITTPLIVFQTPDTLNCAIEEIQIDASNSSNGLIFNYLWSTGNGNIQFGENSLNPQVNDGGDYDLTITNMENGCTAMESIEVIQDTIAPVANAGMEMTLTCTDTILALNGNGSSQGNTYNYLWSTNFGNIIIGGNTLTPLVDELGNYEITVTNNNNQCTATDIVQVFQDTIAPEIEINVIGGLILTCDVGTVVLDASNSTPFGNLSFTWNTPNGSILSGDTTSNPEIDLAGEYFLILTDDSNGCTSTEMVAITDDYEEPIVNIITPDILTCVDTVITLSGQGSTEGNNIQYMWTTLGGNIISGENEVECIIDAPGTYTLTVLDTDNGCFISESISVLENVVAPIADAGGAYEFDCIQSEKMLQATASEGIEFIYEWSTDDGNIVSGANSLEPIVDAFGIYLLTVTNTINGCTTTSAAVVTEDLDTPQNIEVDLMLPLCYGDANGEIEVVNIIGGEPPYEFALDNQPLSSNNVFAGLASGSYLISIRDASGCEFEKLIDLPDPDEVDVDLGEDQYLELGESTTLEAITNIPLNELDTAVWTTTGILECEDCLEQSIAPLRTAGYTVLLTNENGCTTMDTIIVYVNNKRRIYIPNAFSPNGDGANDRLTIYGGLGVDEIEKFQIFSRWGELVFEKNNFQPNDASMGWDGIFNGQKMNTGVFVFYAKIKYTNGESEVMKGDIFLK